ncbi:HB2L protein, partial [Pycnonotus jocosus]|nr:HB2L protein [Pycnonotus jocosus]
GAPPDLCPAHSGVFQRMFKAECHFINGTEKVRYVARGIYNREELYHYDSDVGHFVGLTPYGEKLAQYWNSDPDLMENRRTAVDWLCRVSYKIVTPFSVERRVPPSSSQSIPIPSQ